MQNTKQNSAELSLSALCDGVATGRRGGRKKGRNSVRDTFWGSRGGRGRYCDAAVLFLRRQRQYG
eukprot:3277734-Rhodomonas_salina.3